MKTIVKTIKIIYNLTFYDLVFKYTRFCGLMPIEVLKHSQFAKTSFFTVCYSIIIYIIVSILLIICQIVRFSAVRYRDEQHQTIIVLLVIESAVTSFKTLWLYLSQIIYRHKLVQLVNKAFRIKNDLIKFCGLHGAFFDKNCQFMTRVKMCAVCLQVYILIFSNFAYKHFHVGSDFEYYSDSVLTFLTDCISLIFGCVYFGSMIVILQLFRHLNRKLESAIICIYKISENDRRKMKMQMYCDVCDTIDQITMFYGKISFYTLELVTFLTFPLTISILASFLNTLSGVTLRVQ